MYEDIVIYQAPWKIPGFKFDAPIVLDRDVSELLKKNGPRTESEALEGRFVTFATNSIAAPLNTKGRCHRVSPQDDDAQPHLGRLAEILAVITDLVQSQDNDSFKVFMMASLAVPPLLDQDHPGAWWHRGHALFTIERYFTSARQRYLLSISDAGKGFFSVCNSATIMIDRLMRARNWKPLQRGINVDLRVARDSPCLPDHLANFRWMDDFKLDGEMVKRLNFGVTGEGIAWLHFTDQDQGVRALISRIQDVEDKLQEDETTAEKDEAFFMLSDSSDEALLLETTTEKGEAFGMLSDSGDKALLLEARCLQLRSLQLDLAVLRNEVWEKERQARAGSGNKYDKDNDAVLPASESLTRRNLTTDADRRKPNIVGSKTYASGSKYDEDNDKNNDAVLKRTEDMVRRRSTTDADRRKPKIYKSKT